jgi:hypothetical protein
MEFLFGMCERICLFLACMPTCGLLIHLHCGPSLHWISLAHLLMLFDGTFWLGAPTCATCTCLLLGLTIFG